MKTLIIFLLVSLPFLSPSHEATSIMRCLVEPKSVKNTFKKSTAVFSGEVLETKSGINFLQARFRVERSWKGVEADEVLVITDGTAESPHYRVGEKYLVFAGIRDGSFSPASAPEPKSSSMQKEIYSSLEKVKVKRKPQEFCLVAKPKHDVWVVIP